MFSVSIPTNKFNLIVQPQPLNRLVIENGDLSIENYTHDIISMSIITSTTMTNKTKLVRWDENLGRIVFDIRKVVETMPHRAANLYLVRCCGKALAYKTHTIKSVMEHTTNVLKQSTINRTKC